MIEQNDEAPKSCKHTQNTGINIQMSEEKSKVKPKSRVLILAYGKTSFTHRLVGVVAHRLCRMWKVDGSMRGERHFEDV